MDSEAYWAKRAEEREAAWQKKSRETLEKELAAYYEASLDHIQRNIDALYGRFAKDNALSIEEGRKLLTGKEYHTWRMSLEEYVAKIDAGDKMLERELNTLAMRSRISRFDKLYSETLMELDGLGRKTRDRMDGFLGDAYRDNYYRGLYEIGHVGKALPAISQVDSKSVEAVLRTPWSGKNYSTRIWKNQKQLAQVIQDEVVASVHRGEDVRKVSRRVAEIMGVGLSNAQRLVRTELNYVHNQAALDSIRDAEMDYFRFVATLDSRTSTMCREHDGKIYPIDAADTGENIPPLHPRCRSIIVGSLGGKEMKGKTRIAKDDDGKYIHVPAEMNYEDFQKVYVEKSQTVDEWKEETFGQRMARVQWPKWHIDKRNVGEPISEKDLNTFKARAEDLQITLDSGFEEYCGETSVLYEVLDHLSENKKLLINKGLDDKIILKYDYVKLYGNVDVEAFAQCKKGVIILNKYFFDDTEFLKREYLISADPKDEAKRLFTRGTTYKNIVDHEFGHLLVWKYKKHSHRGDLTNQIKRVILRRASIEKINIKQYIRERFSRCALSDEEIVAEIFAKSKGSDSLLAKEILKEVGIYA